MPGAWQEQARMNAAPRNRPIRLLLVAEPGAALTALQAALAGIRALSLQVEDCRDADASAARLGEADMVIVDLGSRAQHNTDRLLKLHARCPAAPKVVLLDPADEEELGHRVLQAGALDYLVHGQCPPALLLRTIRHVLQYGQVLAQRDRALRDLQHSERRFRMLFEKNPAALFMLDGAGRLQLSNAQGLQQFGLHPEQLPNMPLTEIFSEDAPSLRAALQACVDSPAAEVISCDWVRTDPDGSKRWARSLFRRMSSSDRAPLILMVSSDITREETQGNFLNAMLDNIRDGIIACDMAGHAVFHNRAMSELLGLPETLPPGEWLDRLRVLLADGQTALSAEEMPMRRALGGELTRDRELIVITPAGETRTVLATGVPLIESRSGQLGAVVSMHDITQRKQIEQQLQQIVKMEAVGQLSGGLAHDFNNLLAVIIGNLQLLEPDLPTDPALRRRFAAALDSALSGARLVRQLLAFARRQVLAPERVDLVSAIDEMLEMLRRSIGGNIEISKQVTGEVAPVRVDPALLEASILNLALNARDAMPEGGQLGIELCTVQVSPASPVHQGVTPGLWVTLTVTDTGSGMSEEVREHALEPFFSTKEIGKGSGLGLPMVYGFVTQSGGHLLLDTAPGQGTRVRLYFPPDAKELAGAEDRSTESAAAVAAHPGAAQEKILLVEDDHQVREVAAHMLKDLGYEVVQAAHGDAALAALADHPDTDLLLTDIVMPGSMLGTELARRARHRQPGIKVLFTSGYAEQTLTGKQFDEGEVLLSKPYRSSQLARAVRQVLDR